MESPPRPWRSCATRSSSRAAAYSSRSSVRRTAGRHRLEDERSLEHSSRAGRRIMKHGGPADRRVQFRRILIHRVARRSAGSDAAGAQSPNYVASASARVRDAQPRRRRVVPRGGEGTAEVWMRPGAAGFGIVEKHGHGPAGAVQPRQPIRAYRRRLLANPRNVRQRLGPARGPTSETGTTPSRCRSFCREAIRSNGEAEPRRHVRAAREQRWRADAGCQQR